MGDALEKVLESFQALLNERTRIPSARDAGHGNFRCERCEGCSHCRFCSDSTDCEDCTYCDGCVDCSGCTHCKECDRCTQTTHSTWSSACKDCSYVTLCLDCSGCVQCFACVGLRNEEFCILNEKLPRKTYFSRVAELRGAFEKRIAAGWRPPWLVEDERGGDEPEPELEAEPFEQEPEPELEAEPFEREPAASVIVEEPGPGDSSSLLSLETLWANELADPSPVLRDPDADSGPLVSAPARTDRTVDTGEPLETPNSTRPRTLTPPWTFADVERGRSSALRDDSGTNVIPEPPPFGAADSDAPVLDSVPRRRPASSEEPTRRRDQAELFRDRYGWSAQAEGTPASLGWRASELGPQRERPSSRSADDERPFSRRWADRQAKPSQHRDGAPEREPEREHEREVAPRRGWEADMALEQQSLPRWDSKQREQDTRPSHPRSEEGFLSGWSPEGPDGETRPRPARKQASWATATTAEIPVVKPDEPPPSRSRMDRWIPDKPLGESERRRRQSETSLDRRRRETAASPSATPPSRNEQQPSTAPPSKAPPPARSKDPSAPHEQASALLSPDLDEWLPYEDSRRSELGPEEQTEPDAPVARRGPARAEISGAARASSSRSGPAEWPDDRRTSGSRPIPKSSLGLARRPERPRPPEPRERGALLRGRAPARPAASPANPRQTDAPSLRQARRPARSRDDTTSKFRAILAESESDPGKS